MTIPRADLVQVWIPTWLLPQVYRFVAERVAAGPPVDEALPRTASSTSPEPKEPLDLPLIERSSDMTREDKRRAFWTRDRVEAAYLESPDSMKAFLEVLAESPGERLYTNDLEGPLSMRLGEPFGWRSMAGMLGGFSNRLQTRLGVKKLETWPFDCQKDNKRGRYFYIMANWCATWISELAAHESKQ